MQYYNTLLCQVRVTFQPLKAITSITSITIMTIFTITTQVHVRAAGDVHRRPAVPSLRGRARAPLQEELHHGLKWY